MRKLTQTVLCKQLCNKYWYKFQGMHGLSAGSAYSIGLEGWRLQACAFNRPLVIKKMHFLLKLILFLSSWTKQWYINIACVVHLVKINCFREVKISPSLPTILINLHAPQQVIRHCTHYLLCQMTELNDQMYQ